MLTVLQSILLKPTYSAALNILENPQKSTLKRFYWRFVYLQFC